MNILRILILFIITTHHTSTIFTADHRPDKKRYKEIKTIELQKRFQQSRPYWRVSKLNRMILEKRMIGGGVWTLIPEISDYHYIYPEPELCKKNADGIWMIPSFNAAVIKKLVKAGANPNVFRPNDQGKDESLLNVLLKTSITGINAYDTGVDKDAADTAILKLLLDHKADPDLIEKSYDFFEKLRPQQQSLLLDYGADLSFMASLRFNKRGSKKEDRCTTMHFDIHYRKPTIEDLRTYLRIGIDPNAQDSVGQTSLHALFSRSNADEYPLFQEHASLLLHAGAES